MDQCNIFCQFDKTLKNEIRKFTINNILATDNKVHFTQMNSFEIKMKQMAEDKTVFGNTSIRLSH